MNSFIILFLTGALSFTSTSIILFLIGGLGCLDTKSIFIMLAIFRLLFVIGIYYNVRNPILLDITTQIVNKFRNKFTGIIVVFILILGLNKILCIFMLKQIIGIPGVAIGLFMYHLAFNYGYPQLLGTYKVKIFDASLFISVTLSFSIVCLFHLGIIQDPLLILLNFVPEVFTINLGFTGGAMMLADRDISEQVPQNQVQPEVQVQNSQTEPTVQSSRRQSNTPSVESADSQGLDPLWPVSLENRDILRPTSLENHSPNSRDIVSEGIRANQDLTEMLKDDGAELRTHYHLIRNNPTPGTMPDHIRQISADAKSNSNYVKETYREFVNCIHSGDRYNASELYSKIGAFRTARDTDVWRRLVRGKYSN